MEAGGGERRDGKCQSGAGREAEVKGSRTFSG